MRRRVTRRPARGGAIGVAGRMPFGGPAPSAGCAAEREETARLRERIVDLEASLQRYETILNEVDVQLSEMDLEGNITFVNDAALKMWRLPREELMGRHYQAYVDAETAKRFYKIFRSMYKTGKPLKNAVFDVTDKDGERRTIEKSVTPMRDATGAITGFRTVSREITDRKRAEEKVIEHRSRLEAIFGSVKDAIITVNPAMQVIAANKSTETICGLAVDEIVGDAFIRSRPRCSGACREVLQQTLAQQKPVKEFVIECDHSLRLHQVVSVSTSPLSDPKGVFAGAVLVIRDITRLRGLERELRTRHRFQNLIGRNKTMQDIYRLLEDLASVDTTVLVTGESGTGKELVARALHYSGNRSFKPFVTVNCSALAENLLESELFGHVRGAFTGAIKDKQGRFQAADGGTLLLDEIGDISPMIQLKLLRALQEKEVERVGDTASRKVDVRVIASTNRNLKEKVARGELRQDLYYRLKVVEVTLPPLRERLEDVPLLVEHFRCLFNQRFEKRIEGISGEVLGLFMAYPWPGNVRELEHAMEHAFVLCHSGALTLQHLPADIRSHADGKALRPLKGAQKSGPAARRILEVLRRTDWNKAKAARMLGIGRRTIYRKIEAFDLERERNDLHHE